MEPQLSRALTHAGLKLGGGLALVAVLVGIRVVTAEPAGVAAGVEALERLEAELETERTGIDHTAERPASGGQGDASAVERRGLLSRRRSADNEAPRDRDGDRLVSCRIGGAVQFTRAADCLSRGGQSTDFEPED